MKHTRFIYFIFCLLCVLSCREEAPEKFDTYCPEGDLIKNQTLLGNPSGARADLSSPNNYLMEMEEYTVSYSRDRGIPNWVSWRLTKDWYTGIGSRTDLFRVNPFLPSNWISPNQYTYEGSGFDRGHNCPSADRLCTDVSNASTFFMTNIIPQSPSNNRKIWKAWECYFRYLADKGNELYIVMGNYGQGGVGSKGEKLMIENDDVTVIVPESVWKVAIVIPEGDGDDIQAVNSESMVIAIDVVNDENVCKEADWDASQFITTVDDIEAKMGAGFDLFSKLPASVQSAIENRKHTVEKGFIPCL